MTKKPPIADSPLRMVSYARVSTAEQAASGLGLEAQAFSIDSAAASNGWAIVARKVDAQSGAGGMRRRPGLAEALELVESGNADGIVVAKLDRLSRSVLDFATLLCRAKAEGWNLVVLDLGLDLSTPQGEFTAHVLCAAAQLERRLIGQRTKEALAAAKARGVHVGATSKVPASVVAAITERREAGATLTAIADALNLEGTSTATGQGRWHAASVRAVLGRTVAVVG